MDRSGPRSPQPGNEPRASGVSCFSGTRIVPSSRRALLFLKYQDALARDKALEAALESWGYAFILGSRFRWEAWAPPEGARGWKPDQCSAHRR